MTTTPGPGAQHRAQQPTQEPTRDLAHGQAHKRALGAYGEELAARHLVAAGMVVLDRNWRGPAGEIDLVLRDGSTLVVCEVKTRSSEAFGTPHEAVDAGQARPAAPAGCPVGAGARGTGRRHPHRRRRRAAAPPRAGDDRARPGRGLMLATAHTFVLEGAMGHLIEVQVDISPGVVGATIVGRPDASLLEARDRVRMAVTHDAAALADHPAGDDPAGSRRPAQARDALRPRHRARGEGGRRRRAPRRPGRHRLPGRAGSGRPAPPGGRRAADGDGGGAPRLPPGLRARAAGP